MKQVKTFCDRCGKEITQELLEIDISKPLYEVRADYRYTKVNVNNCRDLDLCNDCRKELLEWLMGGKK